MFKASSVNYKAPPNVSLFETAPSTTFDHPGLHRNRPVDGAMFEVNSSMKCAGAQVNQTECPYTHPCQMLGQRVDEEVEKMIIWGIFCWELNDKID